MDNEVLFKLLNLIDQDKISELEAERLLNAAARLDSGTPTGVTRVPVNQIHTH